MNTEASVVELVLESDLKNCEVAEEVARRVSGTAGFDEDDQRGIEALVEAWVEHNDATRFEAAA